MTIGRVAHGITVIDKSTEERAGVSFGTFVHRLIELQSSSQSPDRCVCPNACTSKILFSLAVWGWHWGGKAVECQCDNMAVVVVVNAGYSKDKSMMHLMWCMCFLVAHFQVQLRPCHVRGVDNIAVDALSHNDIPHFLQVVPDAVQPTAIPEKLVDLLVREQPDWTSTPLL